MLFIVRALMPERATRASAVEIKNYQETSDCEAVTKLTKAIGVSRTYALRAKLAGLNQPLPPKLIARY